MKLQDMSYGTLVLLIIFCLIDNTHEYIKKIFKRKPKKIYRYFSGNIIGIFPGLYDEIAHIETESISDNIRYETISDIWEVFKISHNDSQDTDIHQGRRGYWIIIDNEFMIKNLEGMFIKKTKLVSTPMIQV